MKLEEKLNEDLKTALKGKDTLKLSVIRMLKADITKTAIAFKKNSLDDTEILKVIQKSINQRKDSIEQFKKGNRDDLAQKEEKELKILKGYMPEQLTDAELEKIIKDIIAEMGAVSKKEMGGVIKKVIEATKGKADGKRVSQAAGRLLKG